MAAPGGEDQPRSRRVGTVSPAPEHRLSSLILDTPSPPSSPIVSTPPSIPARSPLRPPPPRSVITVPSADSALTSESSPFLKLSISTSSTEDDIDSGAMPSSLQMHSRSLPILIDEAVVAKRLPLRPESPLALSPMDDEAASSTSSLGQQIQTLTKRQHALLELLASERAYASDLALVKDVYFPLAIGQSMLSNAPPISPPHSSASSSRTMSTASDSSTGSSSPPMSREDAKIIFSNIAELATFSDNVCNRLQKALGSMLEGGTGEDRVGALFLEKAPEMERPYKYYITRQGTADEHLQSLPKTPALEAYFAQTRSYSTSVSHAWDLHSLLIKPVQRLLKYPLLLGAILDETPDTHPDKESLRLAKAKIEDVARNVNEERRRAEVVKGVLMGDPKKKLGAPNISVAASVNLSKIKSMRKGQPLDSGSTEAVKVERMQEELKRIEVFAEQFARDVVDWTKGTNIVVQNLKIWAVGFAQVIGLSEVQGSDAFDAFRMVLEQQLTPLCVTLEKAINERLLNEVATLVATMKQPLKLLESMDEQEPFHYHLLTMNVSAKNRPPPALLEASTNYLALRGQLAKELPRYLELIHRGIALFIRRLADIQTQFWLDMRDRWGDLWEMLRVEGEMNAGAEETIEVWRARWMDVDEGVRRLSITNPRKLYQEPAHRVSVNSTPRYAISPSPATSRKGSGSSATIGVMHALYSLDPAHTPHVSMPYPLSSSPPSKGRGRGYSDSKPGGKSSGDSKAESIKSSKSSKAEKKSKTKPPRPPADDWSEIISGLDLESAWGPVVTIPRTKSMPLPKNVKASSVSASASSSSVSSKPPVIEMSPMEDFSFFPPAEDDRGRNSRKPSFRKKLSETLRSNSNSRQRPSSSRGTSSLESSTLSSFKTETDVLLSAPFSAQMDLRRHSWSSTPAKYTCRVVHPCKPPLAVSYFSFPFFTLTKGDLYDILQEAGHPSIHPKLPLYVDDGEDCLLLCRNALGVVGWALASFLEPLGGVPVS